MIHEQFYHYPLLHGSDDLQQLSKTPDMMSRPKTELWHRFLTLSAFVFPGSLSLSSQ